MDRNFVSVFRAIPFWPNNLVPLDEIFSRLLKFLGVDEGTAESLDPLALVGGVFGVRSVRVHRFDGVTTVTGEIAIATELVLAPGQSYVGFVLGDASAGATTFPFSLRLKDEPPIVNEDAVFFIEENALDPQLAAFQPVEKDPDAGFLDIGSWLLRLHDVPAKLRLINGVTRVEPIHPGDSTRGFRELPDEHVDAGITLSLTIDADGNVELWPPDPTHAGAAGDPAGALDLDLGLFRVDGSSLVLEVSGLGYHRAGDPFPAGLEVPDGLPLSWEGYLAEAIEGFWAKVPTEPEDEEHVYGLAFEHVLVGNDVFAARGSFQHGGGPDDPFASTVPVDPDDLPSSRWSLRRIEVSVTEGVGDFLQFGMRATVAAIVDFFDNQPVQFELSGGRILKAVEGVAQPLPFVELQGALAPVQNVHQPAADGSMRLPLFNGTSEVVTRIEAEIDGVRFELSFPGGEVPGVAIPTLIEIQMDLGIEIGGDAEEPLVGVDVSGFGLRYVSTGDRIEPIFEGVAIETKQVSPLDLWGYRFSISRISFGLGGGEASAYWLGFDAHLEFPDAIGRADVYGMRIGWDDDGALFSIEGVGIAVQRPQIEFTGIVRFLDGSSSFVPSGEEPITIQRGSLSGFVRLAFPAAGIPFSFDVGLAHGKYVRDAVPGDERSFWMLTADLVLPAGLPLGLADLSFYGLAIAFGDNVTPRKSDETPWFDWYARDNPEFNIVAPTKWTPAHGRSAYGLGATLGSAFRAGYPHNERAMIVLNTASESRGSVWLLDAKIRFLKEVSAGGRPNIAVLAVIAPDQILFRAEFHFSFPAEGNVAEGLVITTRGMIEVLVDRTGAGRHHVYLGRNLPYSDRINAEVLLGFFTARAFYMLDWAELALSSRTIPPFAMGFGFAQGWTIDKRYGPLRFYLEAGVELEVAFSFAPAVYGYLRVYGGAGLRIWGFGFGLTVDAAFTLFIADGWELGGELRVKLNLPWPIPDYKKTLSFDWGPGTDPPTPVRSPLRQLALSAPVRDGDLPVLDWSEGNAASRPEGFDEHEAELAVDGSLVLSLRVPTANEVAWLAGTDVRPVDGSGEWQIRYTLVDLILRRRVPGGPGLEPVPAAYRRGLWEIDSLSPALGSAPLDGPAPLSQAIRIWGDLPGEHLRNLGSLERAGSVTWLEGFLDLFETWPCGPDVDLEPICLHFDLPSFRVLDAVYTRVTLLPDGTSIRSRPVINPDAVPDTVPVFVTLDEIETNPRPDLWDERAHVLRLPYLYVPPTLVDPRLDKRLPPIHLPLLSALDVELPPSVQVTVTLIGVLPGESFIVQGFHGGTRIASSAVASGTGLHVLEVLAPRPGPPVRRVRILSVNPFTVADGDAPGAVSKLASVCYRTVDQVELDEHLRARREQLDTLVEVVAMPPGEPGENAAQYALHPAGTEYELTPVVTAERRGPDGAWSRIHDSLQLEPATVTAGLPPADLTPYLDRTVPAAHQDPVYLGDDVQLRFNRSYGPEMYTVSGFDFRVGFVDSQDRDVPTTQEWIFSEEPALTPAEELLFEALREAPCIDADVSLVRRKLEVMLRPDLEPRAYYRLAIRSSAHPGQALVEVPFYTSAYRSFDEQFLELEGNVVHEMLPRAVSASTLVEAASVPALEDREEENAALEEALESGLGLAFRETPRRGEVVVLYEPGPGAPVAILVDSPEPLLVERRTSLEVVAPLPASASVSALRSRDGARTLLFATDPGGPVPLAAGGYELRVVYRRSVPGLPTQRRGGDASDSSLAVTVPVEANVRIDVEAL